MEMAINSSEVRDTARILKVNKNTVIRTLKKQDGIVHVNPLFHASNTQHPLAIRLELACDAAELDEQWSFVGKNPIKVDCGMLLIIQPIRYFRMFFDNAKTLFSRMHIPEQTCHPFHAKAATHSI